ncbi:hypothetical protein SNE40_019940 [Patella caerulea]|uniref:PiggyBac transposable element-derived protein domain-containing protein n=1 Tax=Patella caerulea TaxID=87958 RepID=A0AAN8GD92_PATCE
MTASIWKRVVPLISTADDPTRNVEVNRRQKDGSSRTVACPKTISEYNKYMGGVDRADQLHMEYPTYRMCRRWWVYIFYFLLDVSISNAFICYKESENHKKGNSKDLMIFRINLAKQLLDK